MLAFLPRQCCQHSLLVAPCLLLDFSVLKLVDVHLSLLRVWVDRGAVEEVLRQGRAAWVSSAERPMAFMFDSMAPATCALPLASSSGVWADVAAAGAGGGVDSASQVLASW
jgi:hypothetical protein